jgi:hypothetical protein
MQAIYNYIPETSPVSTVYSVAAVLYLQFVLHGILIHLWKFACARVQCPMRQLFSVSLISFFLVMSLRYSPSDYEMVPFATVIIGITCFHIPHALNFCCEVFIF